jgi:3-oxosteroid 1-dehydrogenase
MSDWDMTTDAVVVGSGAAALSGALTARARGLDVLVLEKTEFVGGSTGISGGLIWLPNNSLMQADSIADSEDAALAYFDAVVGDPSPASSLARRRAFVAGGSGMVTLWRQLGIPLRRADGYPDYHSGLPGGSDRGRNIEVALFDLRELGAWGPKVQAGMFAGLGLVGYATELSTMLHFNKSLNGLRTAARVQLRTWAARLRRQKLVGGGGALVGRLLLCAVEQGAEICTETPVRELIVDDGAVVGVVVQRDGQDLRVGARHGVLLAAGGFSRNGTMRARFGADKATSSEYSMAYAGDTGEVLEMAMGLGAATDLMDEAIWVPVMRMPDGNPPPRSKPRQFMAFSRARWRAGSILVDADGRRYANESMSYRELGQLMFARDKVTKAIPSWLVFDDDFRRRCVFGVVPGRMPGEWIRDGFVKKANSLERLAAHCGIEVSGLQATVTRFNGYARKGVDPEFHRGESAYDRFMGDPHRRPNNCLAPLERPPFYAAAVFPGDVGTFGGLLTDEHARVLRHDGEPIPGLYAAGNITASVAGRGYFGAGGSIGPACTFGHVAMSHVAERAGNRPTARPLSPR